MRKVCVSIFYELNQFLSARSAIGEQFLQTYDNDIEIVCQMIRNCAFANFLLWHAIKAIMLFSLFCRSFILNGITGKFMKHIFFNVKSFNFAFKTYPFSSRNFFFLPRFLGVSFIINIAGVDVVDEFIPLPP